MAALVFALVVRADHRLVAEGAVGSFDESPGQILVAVLGVAGAIRLTRVYSQRKRNFVGQHFLARGYFVSTAGRDEQVMRDYIRNQEKEGDRLEQFGLCR